MNSGIYKIVNIVNGKFYIGSAVNIEHRWSTHKWNLNRNKHHSKYLQASWNKYGCENFEFVILEKCERNYLLIKEQAWIDWTKCYNRTIGYNARVKAESNAGLKWTEEKHKHHSNFMKGFKHTEEAKAKMRGRIKTPEEIYKVSQAKIGKARSDETRSKISEANKGVTRNRNIEKWPHGTSKCKCQECRNKRNEELKLWLKTTNKKYIRKNKNYEVINVCTF